MKRIVSIASLLFGLLAIGCEQKKENITNMIVIGKTMGTQWKVSLVDFPKERISALREKIQKRLDADENELSTWKKRFSTILL